MSRDLLRVDPPLFVLNGRMHCWKCNADCTVIALAALSLQAEGQTLAGKQEPELLILTYIEDMPVAVLHDLAAKHPAYRKHHSKTAEQSYFANMCACGANFGDHYLTGVDGPFFPQDEKEAEQIEIFRMPFEGKLTFRASFSQGTGQLIWKHGRHS